ncbi:hypothetical protein E2C01_023279 [Portunus trituberculatus]|uniref:Uncharacterized protein n=1 Tax=Portunus trituberculatus TaxID=210409 RepID=A0A5B7E9L0_PORTR|nr:hypothetical protein [Portunus trituberculatus]
MRSKPTPQHYWVHLLATLHLTDSKVGHRCEFNATPPMLPRSYFVRDTLSFRLGVLIKFAFEILLGVFFDVLFRFYSTWDSFTSSRYFHPSRKVRLVRYKTYTLNFLFFHLEILWQF